MKFKKGDTVIVMTGKDKGRKGKIEKVLSKKNRVLVPGINMFKRHLKKRDEKNPGGIIDFSRPLPLGNVRLICPKCSQITRIGYLLVKDEKVRICRKCEQEI
jgi:large subunit ribosomal protein L24